MRNASAKFDTTEYGTSTLSKAELVPSTETSQLKTIGGTTHSDVDSPSWTFDIAGVQDWVVSQGLADFLHANHGQVVEVVLQPKAGSGQRIATFNVVCMAPKFGGSQGDWALMELSLPVDGVPAFTVSI